MIPLAPKFLPLPKIALRSLPKKSVTPSTKKDSSPPQKKVCLIKKGGWKIIPDEQKTNHTGMKNHPGWKNPKKNECKKFPLRPPKKSWKLEVGSWKSEVGSWKLKSNFQLPEVGSWKLEVRSWKLEVEFQLPTSGSWKLEVGS